MQVGDFASVYLDGATVAVYIARVTAVNGGGASLDLSTTAISGTAPTTGANGRSCTTGGKWKGPNGASGFPFTFIDRAMTNVSGHQPRVNFKNTANYDITANINRSVGFALTGCTFEGYTTNPGDGGKATIDGGTSGASYRLMDLARSCMKNFILQNNGDSGSAGGIVVTAQSWAQGVVVHDVRGMGITVATAVVVECEAYDCNQSNTAASGGISVTNACAIRCISHDNSGSNSFGFRLASQAWAVDCIADSNGSNGFETVAALAVAGAVRCDSYNNAAHGYRIEAAGSVMGAQIESCNFIKNGGYGISVSATSVPYGGIYNCGFGSGTAANTSGTIDNPGSLFESGNVTYAANVTPWVDPDNGDFRINLAAAEGTGRGNFTETAASYTGTVGYPDIGAAQHEESSGTGLTRSILPSGLSALG